MVLHKNGTTFSIKFAVGAGRIDDDFMASLTAGDARSHSQPLMQSGIADIWDLDSNPHGVFTLCKS